MKKLRLCSPDEEEAAFAQVQAEPVCNWIESHAYDETSVNMATWDYSRSRLIKLEPFQRRILTHVLTPDPETGIFPYRTVIFSAIKKTGKTAMSGAVGAWYADQIEPPNLILCVANNQEQAAGRIFMAMAPTIYRLAGRFPVTPGAVPQVTLPYNGTIIRAIPNNYEGQAGANYGLTLWSELWAFGQERGKRLFEELIPVPTRKNSIRWIETYAGFEGESHLLLELYLKIFTDTTETELQPGVRRVPGLEDLPCFEKPDEGLFVFWDHSRRMPWQQGPRGDQYYAEQAAMLTTASYVRLCENRWQKAEDAFIHDQWWLWSLTQTGPDLTKPMILAADGSVRGDNTALVGVYRVDTEFGPRYRTGYVRVWEPKGKDIDLEETLGVEIEKLEHAGLIDGPVWYDPYQLHQVMLNLKKKGIACKEFQQNDERTKADTHLYRLYKERRIDNYKDEALATNIKNARAKEIDNQRLRLIKGTASEVIKIDAAVAQSMACWKASQKLARRKVKFY